MVTRDEAIATRIRSGLFDGETFKRGRLAGRKGVDPPAQLQRTTVKGMGGGELLEACGSGTLDGLEDCTDRRGDGFGVMGKGDDQRRFHCSIVNPA